jgi:Protein of unknown function (DUF3606)
MTDDRANRGKQDRSRISREEDYEVAYWTKKLGVSREQLAEAVKNVGHSAKAIEGYINGSTVR